MLQVEFQGRNVIVVWSNPELNVNPPDLLILPPQDKVSQPLHEFFSSRTPPCWLQPGPTADRESTKAGAKQELLQCLL